MTILSMTSPPSLPFPRSHLIAVSCSDRNRPWTKSRNVVIAAGRPLARSVMGARPTRTQVEALLPFANELKEYKESPHIFWSGSRTTGDKRAPQAL